MTRIKKEKTRVGLSGAALTLLALISLCVGVISLLIFRYSYISERESQWLAAGISLVTNLL